jgi:ADP-dependent NAD(P)H-hydrate dehydratase / NAD(P)H-hydrate epimerase
MIMDPVASASEMRACDERAIKEYGIPGIVLMENAARAVADVITERMPDLRGKHALILCGRGNNGGDGFALARHLLVRGWRVTVASVSAIDQLQGDARTNAEILRTMARRDSTDMLRLIPSVTLNKLEKLPPADLIVDALLGTGFRGALKRKYAGLVQWLNGQNARRVAVDIPSGIDADSGQSEGVTVEADITCTMGLLKVGLLFSPGRDVAGEVITVDIQIPPEVYRRSNIRTYLIDETDVRSAFPKLRSDVHKYQRGKVFVLAGSTGLTGAAALSSTSALRSGAGAVVLGIPERLNLMMEKKLTEVMTLPLADDGKGALHASAWKAIEKQCEWADVIAAGPGLSRTEHIEEIILKLIRHVQKPMVLDADALYVLARHTKVLTKRQVPVVITPHTGEFARLSGYSGEEIRLNRIGIARSFAQSKKMTLLLKGGPSIVASETGKVYINSSGNPGMATAGSGDVLTGVVAGLLAQGLTADAAAWCGMYLHGYAGDVAEERYGRHAMTAGDIQEALLKVFKGIPG